MADTEKLRFAREEDVKCGNCGADTAKLSAVTSENNRHEIIKLVLTCVGCGDRSIVEIPMPTMRIEWGSKSSGAFSAGWRKE